MSGQALTGGFRAEAFPPAHRDKFGVLGRVRGILLCDQSTVQSMSRSGLIGYFKQHISLGSIGLGERQLPISHRANVVLRVHDYLGPT